MSPTPGSPPWSTWGHTARSGVLDGTEERGAALTQQPHCPRAGRESRLLQATSMHPALATKDTSMVVRTSPNQDQRAEEEPAVAQGTMSTPRPCHGPRGQPGAVHPPSLPRSTRPARCCPLPVPATVRAASPVLSTPRPCHGLHGQPGAVHSPSQRAVFHACHSLRACPAHRGCTVRRNRVPGGPTSCPTAGAPGIRLRISRPLYETRRRPCPPTQTSE